MCGIHLIADPDRNLAPQQTDAMLHMLKVTQHRGPDAEGSISRAFGAGHLHLGSNRLRIIDPHARADQPLRSADGRYSLCFNGTIYNYFELRNDLLGQGVQFSTQSDTEVLLQLLIRQGKEALTSLHGMFSLFFYDADQQTLLVARDRFGIKPLYYNQQKNLHIFSSAIQAITQSSLVEKSLRTQAIHEYLSYRYVQPPRTFFENIFQFPAGHYVVMQPGLRFEPRPFVASATTLEVEESQVLKEVEERLTDAVLGHLLADVDSGLFLSGGVDSTLLLALINEQGAHPVPTFSVTYSKEDAAYATRDAHYAAKAASQYGRKHYELPLSASSLEGHARDFIHSIDQPIGDSAAFLTYMLSAEVKKVAGVALSGAGADELFGGYNRHQAFKLYLKHHQLLTKSADFLTGASRFLPTGFSHPLREKFRLWSKLGASLHQDPSRTFQNFITQDAFRSDSPLTGSLPKPEYSPGQEGFEDAWLAYALHHDQRYYLSQDVLLLSDAMSMSRGLEMRLPYLDTGLSEYIEGLPAAFRLKHGRKWILKKLLEKRGGQLFCKRSKEGFGPPLGQWLRSGYCADMRNSLADRQSSLYRYLDYPKVQHMMNAHMLQKADYGTDLWNLWQLSAWLSVHFS